MVYYYLLSSMFHKDTLHTFFFQTNQYYIESTNWHFMVNDLLIKSKLRKQNICIYYIYVGIRYIVCYDSNTIQVSIFMY